MIDRIGEDAPAIFLIGNPIVFQFEATGVDDGTSIRKMAYQLITPNGLPLSSIESIQPLEGEIITLDFQRDLRSALETSAFSESCASLKQHPKAIAEFKIKYWEIVWNKTTCNSTIENEVTTEIFKVLNSAPQFWLQDTLVGGSYMMSFLPNTLTWCKTKCFIFSAYMPTNTLSINIYWGNNSVWENMPIDVPTNMPFTKAINAYNLANYIFNLDQPGYLTVEETLQHIAGFGIVFNGEEYAKIIYEEDCCDSTELRFQSSLGGFSSMLFDIVSISTKANKANTSCGPYTTKPLYQRLLQNGQQIVSKNVVTSIVLKSELDSDDLGLSRFIEDLHNSNKHWLKIPVFKHVNDNSNSEFVQFNITTAQIQSFGETAYSEIVITGTFSSQLKQPV